MSRAVSIEYIAQRWSDAESAIAALKSPTLPQIALSGLAAFNRGVDPCRSGDGPYATVVFVKLTCGVTAPVYPPPSRTRTWSNDPQGNASQIVASDPDAPWRYAKCDRRDVEILARQSLGANAVAFRFSDEWRVFDPQWRRFIPLRRKPKKGNSP